jgi:hypothetical protein
LNGGKYRKGVLKMKNKGIVVLGVLLVLGLVFTGCDALFGKDDEDKSSSGLDGTTWIYSSGGASPATETITFTASSFLIESKGISYNNAGAGSYTLSGETVTLTYTTAYGSGSTYTGTIVGNKLQFRGTTYTKQ